MNLRPQPLTRKKFAPFGDVIEVPTVEPETMNDGRFVRHSNLARIVAETPGEPVIGIVESRQATTLPANIEVVERHRLGSQAFIPLNEFSFVVVVHPPAEQVEVDALRAFVTNGRQGINYHPGTWHAPLMAQAIGWRFLVVDRLSEHEDCDIYHLPARITLVAA